MPIDIRIPRLLRELTGSPEFVSVTAATVGDALKELLSRIPNLAEHLVDANGGLRRFVNVYVNEEDIRFLQEQDTLLNEGDEITIIPAAIEMNSAAAAVTVATQLRQAQHSISTKK